MKGIVALSIGIAVLSVAQTGALAACVDGHPTIEAEFRKVPIVAIGKVESESPAQPPWEGMYEGTHYSLRITETLKGPARKSITLFSENSSGRFPMDIGAEYLMFVHRDQFKQRQYFAVSYCGNSGQLPEVAAALARVRGLKRGK